MKNILLMFALVLGSLSAQTDDSQTEKAEKKKGYRVTAFNAWGGPSMYYKDKKEYYPLKAHRLSYTKPLPYKKGEPIVFYMKSLNAEQEAVYKPYVSTVVPEEIMDPLLVLYWNQVSKKGYAQSLEFSPERFPYGSYQFVNIGAAPIFGYVEDKKRVFKCMPYKANIYNQPIKDGKVIPIEIVAKSAPKNIVVYSSVVKYRSKKRTIFFLYPRVNQVGRTVYQVDLMEDFSRGDDGAGS